MGTPGSWWGSDPTLLTLVTFFGSSYLVGFLLFPSDPYLPSFPTRG